MIVFLDTNVILDILMKREPFFQASYDAVKRCLNNKDRIYFSATAVTDIFYLLRKATGNRNTALQALDSLLHLVEVADTRASDIQKALHSEVNDFEDAVLVEVARAYAADVIISRNVKDFTKATLSVQSPVKWLEGEKH